MEHDIKDLTAALFKNDYKKTDKQPDFLGKVSHRETKEQVYRISAWTNTSKAGKKYLSIRFSDLPEEIKESPVNNGDPFNGGDDVPF